MGTRAVFFDVGYTLFDETRLWREWAEWLGVDDHRLFATLREVIAEGRDHRELFTHHAAYDPGDADVHDVHALHQTFGIPLPEGVAT